MLVHRGIMVHEPIGTAAPGGAPGGYWTRPADWLPLPDLSEGQEKLVGLFAVYDNDSNFVAFRCAGAYHVDWGDGTSEDVASNTTAQHRYDRDSYAALGSGTDCSRGYRQAIITVTPQAGQHLTSISLDYRHNGTAAAYATQWLDVAVVGAYLTSLRIGGTTGRLHMLEQFRLVGLHGITNMNNMFYNCHSLQSVPLFDTANVTSMSSMFYGCCSLQSVPLFNTANVTNMNSMFSYCYSLQSVPLFDTASVTNMSSMFSRCYSLQSVPLFNTANVTNMSGMFYYCYSLQSVPLFNTANVTNMSSMFSNCYSLQSVPLFNTANVTNMSNMFNGCCSLQSVPLFNTAKVTDMSNMFNGCYSVVAVAALSVGAVTSITDIFRSCSSLASAPLSGTAISISYAGCNLARDEIVAIFNGLATVTGQTITITGNWGVANLTDADRKIATDKGWAIAA